MDSKETEPIPIDISETKPVPAGISETKPIADGISQIDPLSYGIISRNEPGSTSASNKIRTMVLVGKTGNGKSSTANTIMGARKFKAKLCMKSVTTEVEKGAITSEDGIIEVIDTPGLFDTSVGRETIGKEIIKCLDYAPNGIHAVLVVVSVRNRFGEDEHNAILCLQALFGSKIFDYVIFVFTGGDDVDDESEDDGSGLIDYLGTGCPKNLKKILELCGGRKVLFDNKTKDESKKYKQVQELLALVDKVMEENDGEPYSHKHFEKDGIIRLHGKNDGFLGQIELMKDQIQEKYDEQLKQMTAKLELEFNEKTRKLQEEYAKAGGGTAELNAQNERMANELKMLQEMVRESEERAKKAQDERAERERITSQHMEKLQEMVTQGDKRAEKAFENAEKAAERLEIVHEGYARERQQAAKESQEFIEKTCTQL